MTRKKSTSRPHKQPTPDELVRLNKQEVVDAIVAGRGPLGPKRMKSLDPLFGPIGGISLEEEPEIEGLPIDPTQTMRGGRF